VRRTWCLAALLCLAMMPRPRGAAAEVVGPQPSVDRLVQQLGDEDFRKRDLANRLLRQLGPDVLPQLRAARSHADPEVGRRLDDLIGKLESAALLAPKLVTLHLRHKTPKQALDAIAKQTGYKIESWNNNEQQTNFDFDGVPFWQAVDRVCRAGGLVVQQGYGDNALHLMAQDSYVPYVCYDHAFRLVADNFRQDRSIEFASLPRTPNASHRSESLNFTFSIYSEPKLPLLGAGTPKLEAAYDSDNNSMMPLPDGNGGPFGFGNHVVMRYGNGYRCYSQQISLPLNRPSASASRVKLLKGSMPVTLLTQEKPEVVTDKLLKAKGKKFKVTGASFSILDVSETPNKQYQVHLTVTDESKDAQDNDYTWVNSLFYRLEVHDDKGQKYQVFGSNWMNSSPKHVEITFTYGPMGNGKIGPPSKLVYHTWTTAQAQVSFEFKDLPLP
jgi:hypothetical protein